MRKAATVAALVILVLAGCVSIHPSERISPGASTETGLTGVQHLLENARKSAERGDYVVALLSYDQAVELEGKLRCGLGEQSISPYEAGAFQERLLNTPDGALLQVLQSDRIPIEKKRNLLRTLEEKVEKGDFPNCRQPSAAR